MNRDRQKLQRHALQLFEQALGLPSEQRVSFLDDACAENTELRADIESLLAASAEADEFLPAGQEDASTFTAAGDQTAESVIVPNQWRLQPGFVLVDRYTILETIGLGGMGEVYRASDSRLDRDVAVKVLNVDSLHDDGMHERFDREIKSVASLSHPNIVTLHDVANHEDIRFAIMELVEGKTLRQLISEKIDWRRAVKLAHGIASGLSSAHSRNVMHRDIKPENVIVSNDGHAKILDFGLARPEVRPTNQELTADASLVPGTVPYMSPEQAESKVLACSTDIFSLGTVLFEMLTGTNPFRAETAFQTMRNVADANPPCITDAVSKVPGKLISLVMGMLTQQPEKRPTAADVVYELNLLQQLPVGAESLFASARDDSGMIEALPTNLPRRRVVLTGRDEEIKIILARLGDHPIVTLVGPGGVGKTSLAIEVAREAHSQFPGGIWLCEFAPLRDGKDVAEVLAGVLDGSAGSMSEVDLMVTRLQEQPTLLVFDNCEHVIDAVAELVETLSQRVSHLHVLATSRESLNVAGEYVNRLDGLPFTGTSSSAVDLFIKRASSLAGFEDTPDRRPLVEEIVTRLEGLPLAIELATPQLATMSLEELLHALDDQLSTLQTSRPAANRQSTVSRAIAWSFDLLGSEEQEILLSLSVFAAAFTSEAAMAICKLPAGGRRQLQRLVEQSVVVRTERQGHSRFRLLEPIRQFCQAQIDPGSLTAARLRHAYFYAERATELGKGIYGVNEIQAADALNVEWPDLRKAISWGREHSAIEVAIDPIVALNRAAMFQLRMEAYQWMSLAVEQFGDEATSRADVHSVIGTGMWIKGDMEQAQKHLDLSDQIEPTSQNLYMRYSLLYSQNRFTEALEIVERARKIARAYDDELECRWLSLPFAANTLTMVDPTDPRIDQSLATASAAIAKLDWPTGEAYLLMNRGVVAMTRGDLSGAAEFMKQSIDISNSCGDRALAILVGFMVNGLPDTSITAIQRLESTVSDLKVMIETGVETGDVSFYPAAVRSTIVAMAECDQFEIATKCSAIIESLKGSGDHNELTPQFLPTMERVAESLGQEEFDKLQREGAHLTVEDIAKLGEQLLNSLDND